MHMKPGFYLTIKTIILKVSIGIWWKSEIQSGRNISNTRKSVPSNTEKWVEKTKRSQFFFLTDLEVIRYVMKHSFDYLIRFPNH